MTVLKKLLLIVNPNAGTRQAHRLLPEMISALTAGGYLVTVCVTDKNGDASAFARDHAGDADLVVACGGDGTLNEVVSGLLSGGHATPVGYIPAGSTNDFAATLGLSRTCWPPVKQYAAVPSADWIWDVSGRTGISAIPLPSARSPAFPGPRRRT